jgi:hypothetical protein
MEMQETLPPVNDEQKTEVKVMFVAEENMEDKMNLDDVSPSSRKNATPITVSTKHMGVIEGVSEEKGNTFEYAVKDRKFLNYVVVLFLLLIGRFGSILIEGDIYNGAVVPQINNILLNSTIVTNWNVNSTQYYVDVSFLSGYIGGELMNLVYGLLSVFLIIPLLEAYITRTTPSGKGLKERPKDLAAYVIKKHKIPYHPFVLFSFCLLIFNLGFYLCFKWWVYEGVTVFRTLFGVCDAVHRYLSFLFICKQFYQQHLIFALGLFFATDALIQIFSSVLRSIASIGLFDILLISNIVCAISTVAIIALPILDFEKQSIFKTVVSIKHRDVNERYYWRKYPALIYIPIHVGLVFVFSFCQGFLQLLTADMQYPADWLENARIMQVLIQAISMPAIGGILDMQQVRMHHDPKASVARIIYLSLRFYKWNYIFLFLGVAGVTTMSSLFSFVKMKVFTSLLTVAGFQGFFLSAIQMPLLSFPIIFVRNIDFRYKSLLYPAYMNSAFLAQACANFVKFWIFSSQKVFTNVIWIFVVFVGSLDLITLFILFPIVLLSAFFLMWDWIKPFRSIDAGISLSSLKMHVDHEKKDDDYTPPKKKPHYWRLIYLIPAEFLVLLLSLTVLFTTCGGLNILLHSLYSTTPTQNVPNIIFLPILFSFTVVSAYLTFPSEILRLVGAVFFRKTRNILFGEPLQTIGRLLSSNPAFCMAHEAVKKKEKLYQGLWSSHLTPKVTISVVPDDVVLPNEDDRFVIMEMKESTSEDVDKILCSNGLLWVDRENIKKINMFPVSRELDIHPLEIIKFRGRFLNSHNLYRYFHMFAYVAYGAFFLIPLVYKLILKATCVGSLCGTIVIFEDSIQGVILAIDFIFGFFLFIPFVEIFRELCRILERSLHQCFSKMY